MGSGVSSQLARCPAGTRLLTGAYLCTTAALGALGDRAPLALRFSCLCNLATVAGQGYWWALLSSALYRPLSGALDLVFVCAELFLASNHLARRELELGSARFLLWAPLAAAGANAAFLACMKVASDNGVHNARYLTNQGLWPMATVCITLQVLRLPSVMMSVLGVLDVPSRWYPLGLSLGFSAMRGVLNWGLLASNAFGYTWEVLRLEQRLLPSAERASGAERAVERAARRWLGPLPGLLGAVLGGAWVPADPEWGPPPPAGFGGGRSNGDGGGRPSAGSFRLFGGPGRRLSD